MPKSKKKKPCPFCPIHSHNEVITDMRAKLEAYIGYAKTNIGINPVKFGWYAEMLPVWEKMLDEA